MPASSFPLYASRESSIRTRFVLDSQRDSLLMLLLLLRKEEAVSFFSSFLASINLSSPFARRLFSARRLCTRACTQLGCYRARVSSRVIMFNEGEVTGNVSLSRIRCGRRNMKKWARDPRDSLNQFLHRWSKLFWRFIFTRNSYVERFCYVRQYHSRFIVHC